MLLHLMSPQGALPAEADQIIKHSNRKHQTLQSAGAKGRQATIAQKGGDKNSDEPDLGQVLHGHGRRRGAEEPLQIPGASARLSASSGGGAAGSAAPAADGGGGCCLAALGVSTTAAGDEGRWPLSRCSCSSCCWRRTWGGL